jgi:hypothetical protein
LIVILNLILSFSGSTNSVIYVSFGVKDSIIEDSSLKLHKIVWSFDFGS